MSGRNHLLVFFNADHQGHVIGAWDRVLFRQARIDVGEGTAHLLLDRRPQFIFYAYHSLFAVRFPLRPRFLRQGQPPLASSVVARFPRATTC